MRFGHGPCVKPVDLRFTTTGMKLWVLGGSRQLDGPPRITACCVNYGKGRLGYFIASKKPNQKSKIQKVEYGE